MEIKAEKIVFGGDCIGKIDGKTELSKKEDYTDKIEATKQKLESIDKKLGVKKK